MSRLDRFLVSEGFIDKSGIHNQWVGDRDISDHCPIWLVSSKVNWGLKPFKFNNCWINHPGFFDFVKTTWENLEFHGNKAFVLKEKLKSLKLSLKQWNREVFGIVDLNIDKTVQELNEVEDLLATGDGDHTTLNSKELVKQFWEQIHVKERRRRRNQIMMLKKGGVWLEGVTEIKSEAVDQFSHQFAEEWNNRPFLQGIDFNTLSRDDNALLLAPFNEDETTKCLKPFLSVARHIRSTMLTSKAPTS
ncbi:hypothetical protein P8452_22182 [Trifolium repens]|nr:hypothetical protein P8452_22182 [Trifolium repens]